MTEIERMQKYIDKTPRTSSRYAASTKEMLALAAAMSGFEAVAFAFNYGRAKGYRAAKAEVRA